MADFFIRRPTVAIVIAIIMTLLGLAVLQRLSIEQYPELSPPTIRVETTYQGASAEVVEQSVATPIEQQVNGVDNMIYMKSLNTSDGRMLLDISFQVGMNRDMANVLAQNRVSQAQSRLPQEVNQQGVTVKKQNPSILMVISLYSPRGSRDAQFLNNYAMINIRDALLRVPGIATVDLYGGSEYGMRVWLRPDRMAAAGTHALRRHLGHQGAEPAGPSGPSRWSTVTAGPGVHLHGQGSRKAGHAGGVREHHSPPDARRWHPPDQRCGPGRAGERELQIIRPRHREGLHRPVAGRGRGFAHRLPAAGRQPAGVGGGDLSHPP